MLVVIILGSDGMHKRETELKTLFLLEFELIIRNLHNKMKCKLLNLKTYDSDIV